MLRSPRFATATALATLVALGAGASAVLRADGGSTSQPAAAFAPTELSAAQREILRARLAELLRQDSEGLISELRGDGTISLALDGRFHHAVVARPRAAGRPELACFDDPDAALSFLARDDRRVQPSPSGARQPAPEERDR